MNHFQINISETKIKDQFSVELKKELNFFGWHFWFSCKRQVSNLCWCQHCGKKWMRLFNSDFCKCDLNDFTNGND